MKRTIIKQRASYTITLPKKWVEQRGLQNKSEITIEEKDNSLIISGEGQASKIKDIYLDQAEDHAQLRTLLSSAYKAGYSGIIIHFKTTPPLTLINEVVSSLIGLEVVSYEKNRIIIKSLLAMDASIVDNLIKKMFFMIKFLYTELDDKGPLIDLKMINNLDAEIRKNRDHCLRAIHSLQYQGDLSYDYYDLVTQLEKLFVDIKHLSQAIIAKKIEKSAVLRELMDIFEEVQSVYFHHDFKKANNLWNTCRKKYAVDIEHFSKKHGPVMGAYYILITKRYFQIASRLLSTTS